MVPESVAAALLGILVFGALAFHDAIVARVAAASRDSELTDVDDRN